MFVKKCTVPQLYAALSLIDLVGRTSKRFSAAFCTNYDFNLHIRRGGDFLVEQYRKSEYFQEGSFKKRVGLYDIQIMFSKPLFEVCSGFGVLKMRTGKLFFKSDFILSKSQKMHLWLSFVL